MSCPTFCQECAGKPPSNTLARAPRRSSSLHPPSRNWHQKRAGHHWVPGCGCLLDRRYLFPLGRICNTWGVKLGNGLLQLSVATGESAWAATRQTATLVRSFCCCCCCFFRPLVIWRLLFPSRAPVDFLLFPVWPLFFSLYSMCLSLLVFTLQ